MSVTTNAAPTNVLPEGITLKRMRTRDGAVMSGFLSVLHHGQRIGTISRTEDGWTSNAGLMLHATRGDAIRQVQLHHLMAQSRAVKAALYRALYHSPWWLKERVAELEAVRERTQEQEATLEGYRRALLVHRGNDLNERP